MPTKKTRLVYATLFIAILAMEASASRQSSIFIESMESKTPMGDSVYNRIAFFQSGKTDVWMMQQNHASQTSQPDRIALVVDTSQSPAKVKYLQLAPGPLEWPVPAAANRDLKIACYICHSNGARVIRPALKSTFAPLTFGNRLQLWWWNARIKSYGRTIAESTESATPVRFPGPSANQPLKVASCQSCHSETGPYSRGFLVKQNYLSIKFMIENGLMPPLNAKLSVKDRSELDQFLL